MALSLFDIKWCDPTVKFRIGSREIVSILHCGV